MTYDESLEKLRSLIKDGRVGSFATIGSDNNIVSRPLGLQTVEFDGDMWFITRKSSNKIREIAANPMVNVCFESGNSWVSVSGRAEAVEDKQKAEELWNPFVKAYFPDGLEDPELILIKVHAESAEYWDSDNKLVSLFKMAKAAATDTTPDLGDNKTITL